MVERNLGKIEVPSSILGAGSYGIMSLVERGTMPNVFKKVQDLLHDPIFTTKFHKYATLIWILLAIPSVLFWKESLMWIVLMSVWANVAGHWSSYQASRSEMKIDQSS